MENKNELNTEPGIRSAEPIPQSEVRIPKSDAPQSEIRIPKSDVPQSEVRIPKSDAPQSEIRNPHSNIPARILVVDDDKASSTLLESILGASGYAVRVATSGEAALVAVAQQLPDLILLDILLPDIDGFEVTRRLRADARSRPVSIILVTILEDRESRIKGLQAGADEFLSKPVDYTELLTRVKNQLKVREYTRFLAGHNRMLEEQVEVRTAKLQENEEKFRAIFEGTLDGILLANAETKQFYLSNPTMCRMLGYNPDEIIRLGVSDIHPQQDLPHIIEQFEKQLHGEIQVAADIPVKRKDGSVYYADIKSSPVNFGGKTYLVGIFRDVTERKQAEAQVAEQLDELRRWHEATVGIGIRNIELKREVNKLLDQAGQPPRFPDTEQE